MEAMENKENSTFNEIHINNIKQSEKYKAYRKRWSDNPKNNDPGRCPVHLDIELNSNCNLKCVMCFQSFAPPKAGMMDFKLFKKLIDEGIKKGVCSIKLQYRGEPLLYPKVAEAVKYAKDKGIIEVMFNTNANLLTKELSHKLIKAGLDKIICSVDGYDEEFYKTVRINGDFNTVVKNIKQFQEIKKELGLTKPVVRVQMIRLKKIKNMGVHTKKYIDFWQDIADDIGFEDEGSYHKDRNKDLNLVSKDFKCPDLWRRMLVMWNGDYRLCCCDHYGNVPLGNAKDKSIEDAWLGYVYDTFRKCHITGTSDILSLCKRCDFRRMVINAKK